MTANQVAYWTLQETKRSNRAKEGETYRSNVAKESELNRSNLAKELETARSNRANETENIRSHKEQEKLKAKELDDKLALGTVQAGTNILKLLF